MKLYVYEHCPFCSRARMIFGLKNLPFNMSVIMEGDEDTPNRLVGRKVVPILEKADGTHMAESMDIVRHVDASDGEPLLAGAGDARIHDWCKQAWPTVLKLAIPRFTRGNFAEMATAPARAAYLAREQKAFGDLDLLIEQTPAWIAEITPQLAALASLLDERKVIDEADFVLYPILRCLSIVKGLDYPPAVLSYMARLERDSGVELLFTQAM